MIRILIPLDGSSAAEEALNHAVTIASTFPAELTLLRVVEEPDTGAAIRTDSVDLALSRHQAQTYLDSLCSRYGSDSVSIRYEIAEGPPAQTIVHKMSAMNPDLLVLTRFGRGNALDFATGGTAQKIVSSSNCSVLLLDPRCPLDPAVGYQRILVPIDDSKESDCAVAVATMIAEIQRASLMLLLATEEPHLPSTLPPSRHTQALLTELTRVIRREAEYRLRELANKTPDTVPVQTRVLHTLDPAMAVEATAEVDSCDLILLHTKTASTNGGRDLGAMNQSLLQFSRRAIFLLRPSVAEGFASNFRSVYLDERRLEA